VYDDKRALCLSAAASVCVPNSIGSAAIPVRKYQSKNRLEIKEAQ